MSLIACAALGVGVAVPAFGSLLRVQDKVAQVDTLAAVGLAHPPTVIARTVADLLSQDRFPLYLKPPTGTASAGVRRVR